MSLDIAIFGCGYSGSQWAKVVSQSSETGTIYCVDPDPTAKQRISSLPVNFLTLDVFDSESFSQTEQTQFRVLTQCDLWIVAVGKKLHTKFIELAESCGITTLLVEKPLYQTPPQDHTEYDLNVCINYVETVHPVFNAIIEQARKDNAMIHSAFHWRGKDNRSSVGPNSRHNYEHPAVKEDLVHDLSELYIGFSLLNQPTNFTLSSIETCIPWQIVDYNGVQPFTYMTDDAWAKLTYKTNTGQYTIQGGFIDNNTRRFFIWIDKTKEIAYYGNTLLRDYTSPMAYKITGQTNINHIYNTLTGGDIITKEDETQLMNSVSADPLIQSQDYSPKQNFYYMFNKLLSGEAVPTYKDAREIELLAEQFYQNAPVAYNLF